MQKNKEEVIMIVNQIREKMNKKGISVHALEKQAGLKSSAIHNILYGRSKNPSVKVIKAIAAALDCEVSELINDEHPKSTERDSEHLNHTSPSGGEGIQWNSKLYLKSFEKVNTLLKSKGSSITKEKTLSIVDEVYAYSHKTGRETVDSYFAEWLVDKSV
jgi:transcriptional regulator with XRE-family HTH domain